MPFVSQPAITGLPLALTGATGATRFVGATTSGPPTTGTFAVGDYVVDQSAPSLWICTVAGSPGTWAATKSPDPLAVALGYVNYNNSVFAAVTNVAVTLTSQTVYVTSVWLPFGVTCTNVVLGIEQAGSGTTPTNFFVGLASPAGVMKAQSADLKASASLTTLGPQVFALSSTYTPIPTDSSTGLYYVVVLENGAFGTTAVAFWRGQSSAAQAAVALGAGAKPYGTGGTTGQTALPANASSIAGGIVTTNALSLWAGVS